MTIYQLADIGNTTGIEKSCADCEHREQCNREYTKGIFKKCPGFKRFTRYTPGQQQNIYCCFSDFRKSTSLERLAGYDRHAQNSINYAEELIKAIKQYRLDLYNHCQTIRTAAFHLELQIRRRRGCRGGCVTYHVELLKIYEGNLSAEYLIEERFNGKERHKALERYNELKKQYPGIPVREDTAKQAWEK
jgi:hypothetical protein